MCSGIERGPPRNPLRGRQQQEAPRLLLRIGGAPIGRWERDSPEIGLGRIELDRYVAAVGHSSGGTYDLAGNPFFGVAMLEHQARVDCEVLLHRDERTVGIHAQRSCVKCGRSTLERYVYLGRDMKQHALGAPPVLTPGSQLLYGRRWQGASLSSAGGRRGGAHNFRPTGHGRRRSNPKVPTLKLNSPEIQTGTVNSTPPDRFVPLVRFEASTPCLSGR